MPKAQELERLFKGAASLRIRRKERGNKDYENDAGYWDGGLCDWGGQHNLKKDCETIAQGFDKLDELKNVERQLQQCTSKQEFESVKSRLIRQAEELERDLQLKTSSVGSMFGICIIWADFPEFVESRLKILRNDINRLKGNIDKQQYKYYEELKQLKLEQKQIENRMKENKRKAQSEKDPGKKALLLQLIEDDGKKLEENLRKQKEIPTSNLNFDPSEHVSNLIEAMKQAIENSGKNKGGNRGGSSGRNKNRGDDSDDENNNGSNSNNAGGGSGSRTPETKNEGNNNQNQPTQQQLILIACIALLAIFYFYSQQSKSPEENYYDF